MVTWVRTDDDLIVEVLDYDPAGRFHESLTFKPFTTLVEQRAALSDEVRARRWLAETSGVLVGETPIRTDEKSQAKLAGAVALFDLNPALESIDWEAVPGVFVTLDEATIKAIAVAVGAHIQACFAHSRTLCEALAAASTHAALDAIDIRSGWPG
ncbi:MAG TPA: DUF4376 domain-containing protein [Phenylobacterium sp.]|nr:DUF4376 domain-containing protein [Phenylobacterium sp.]